MKASRRRFAAEEYAQRQHKVRLAMRAQDIDVLIVYDPSNMCWLTGFDCWSFYVHQCVVIGTDDDELFWFGRGIDAPAARLTTDLPEEAILSYPDHYVQSTERHPMDYLAGLFQEKGWHQRRIGVEMDNYYFSARAMESLRSSLPDSAFVDATALVNWQRAVKSPAELDYMRQAGTIVERMYQRVMEVAEPGMPKHKLVAEIQHAATLGVDGVYGDYPAIVPLMGAGEEASACHLTWDDSPLQADEGMFMELAGVTARYHCPCSRTLYLGTPPKKYRDIEKVIVEGIEATLQAFKAGNTCGEVASTFFRILRQNGYEKDNRCGYPIGLSYPPDWGERTMSLRESDRTELREGMTFHFMPGMWFDDWGFEMTESVVVGANGGLALSSVPRELLVKS